MRGVTFFVGLLVLGILGVVLMQTTADQTTALTSTYTTRNQSISSGAVGSNVTLNGKGLSGTVSNTTIILINTTFASINNSRPIAGAFFNETGVGNFSVNERIRNGKQVVEFQIMNSLFANQNLNLTYSWVPEGYVSNSATRNIVTLLIIIMAIGLIIWVAASLFDMEGIRDFLDIGRR